MAQTPKPIRLFKKRQMRNLRRCKPTYITHELQSEAHALIEAIRARVTVEAEDNQQNTGAASS